MFNLSLLNDSILKQQVGTVVVVTADIAKLI